MHYGSSRVASTTVDGPRDAVWWTLDAAARGITHVELAHESAFQRTKAQWRALHEIRDAIDAEDRTEFDAAMAQLAKHGAPLDLECRLEAPHSEGRPIRLVAHRGEDGTVRGAILPAEPVLEGGLSRRQRLRAILHGTRVGTWEWNVTNDATVFDRRWAEMLGYTLEELTPVSLETWKNLTHPDDLARASEALARHFAGEVDHYECEIRMRHKDGRWLWILDRGRVATRTENGAPEWMFGTHTDVTEQKRAAEELRNTATLLEGLAELQREFVVEPDARASFRRMLSFLLRSTSSAYGFIGEVYKHPDGRPYIRTRACTDIAWDDATRSFYDANSILGMEFTNLDTLFGAVLTSRMPLISNSPSTDPRRGGLPGGHPSLDAFLGLPLFLGDEMIGMLGMANRAGGYDEDLVASLEPVVATCACLLHADRLSRQRVQADRQQRELEMQLQQAQKLESLGLLAGGIAHDFNNLLTSILGRVELALSLLPAAAPAKEHLDDAVDASVRAGELVNQLLAYAGRARRAVVPVDVTAVAEEMVRLLSVSMPKGCALRLDLQRDLPPVHADAGQLRQVLMNLVINAGEATAERGQSVVVRTRLVELDASTLKGNASRSHLAPGSYVQLEVEDDGSGMDEATRVRIFEPFFTTKFTGRGLGLSAVLGIVQNHGGAIECQSERGVGTTFRIVLPAATGEATALAARASEADDGWRCDATVLLVDDDLMVRPVAQLMLGELGCKVLLAGDGVEALEVLERSGSSIDLVLLDLTMPRMSGEQVLRAMREKGLRTPVVLTSGYHEQGLAAGFPSSALAGFLDKPYTRARFREVIRAALA